MLASIVLIITIMKMKLFAALLACFVLVFNQANYTERLILFNQYNHEHLVFSSDFRLAFFYGPTNPIAQVYQAYNWDGISDEAYTVFPFAPNTMEYFTDLQGRPSLIFANNQGIIKKRSFITGGVLEFSLWTITETPNDIVRATPDSKSSMYAAYCKEDTKIYIGNLSSSQLLYTLDYSNKGIIVSAKWRPNTSQLLISGGNSSQSRYIQLYDVEAKTKEDLSFISTSTILDFVFTNEKTLYFAEEGTQNDQKIMNYNFTTKIFSEFASYQGKKISGLASSLNFLTSYDGTATYVWSLVSSQSQGEYRSTMKSSGLSTDGSALVNLGGSAIQIYTLCKAKQYYSSIADSCQTCLPPCLQCFFTATQCSKCIDGQYRLQNFTCASCIPNCARCSSDTGCQVCNAGYFFNGQNCSLCSSVLQGCVSCFNSSACLGCDQDHFWVLKPNRTCECRSQYVQVGQQCKTCPSHCLLCSQPNTCQSCDPSEHRISNSSGLCICSDGYFDQSDVCYSCSQKLLNCQKCLSEDVCTLCEDGYTLNNQTKLCEQGSGSSVGKIVIIIVAVILLGVLGVFLWRFIKKRREGKMSTMVESASLQDYERVDA